MLSREGKTPSVGLGWGLGRTASYLQMPYAMLGWRVQYITQHTFNQYILGARPWEMAVDQAKPLPPESSHPSSDTGNRQHDIRMIMQVVKSVMKK